MVVVVVVVVVVEVVEVVEVVAGTLVGLAAFLLAGDDPQPTSVAAANATNPPAIDHCQTRFPTTTLPPPRRPWNEDRGAHGYSPFMRHAQDRYRLMAGAS
jgi:hypothetical protein